MITHYINSISHWLLRIPLAIVFIQQGLYKLPFDPTAGEGFGLSALVWFFVVFGELGAGLGLLVGGVISMERFWPWIGDLLSRFSGVVMTCIMTGVIWTLQPSSFSEVIFGDNLNVFLWFGGLFFALKGNKL